ncbi:MAG: C39 family peptidase [Bdellovibrionota bacterium]
MVAQIKFLLLTVLCCLAVGSASLGAKQKPLRQDQPELPAQHLKVPLLSQATDYSCGPAVVLAILRYWQTYDGNERSLHQALGTDENKGTDPRRMAKVLAEHELTVEVKEGLTLADLREALAKGITVVVSFQAWRDDERFKIPWKDNWEDGHYAVLIAMDDHRLYFMDPSAYDRYAYLSHSDFLDRWHDKEETSAGEWRHQHLGILVKGESPMKKFPLPLIHID